MSMIQELFHQSQLAEAAYAQPWDAEINSPISDRDGLIAALVGQQFSVA